MNPFLMDPLPWAAEEFGRCELKDARRTRRLVQVASRLAQSPQGTLPPSFDGWKELRAAYRLWGCPEVTRERLIEPHCRRTQARARQPGLYLLIEDTTQLDYTSHTATEQLGRIGDDGGWGLLLHSSLMLQVQDWTAEGLPQVTLLGLAAQHCWTRPPQLVRGPVAAGKEPKGRRLRRPRESDRWAKLLEDYPALPARAQWVYVADREADIYETFTRCRAAGLGFVLRGNQDRALAQEQGWVLSAADHQPVRFSRTVEVRSHAGGPTRRAQVVVRATTVCLRGPWRPGGRPAPQTLNVVAVREEQPPAGVEAVDWVLLTSLPVVTVKQIKQVLGIYQRRWIIEEYHKALKSGTQIEASQLTDGHRLQALLGVLALVALRLLSTKLLAVAQPQAVVTDEQIGPEARQILAAKLGRAGQEPWTQRELWRGIARLGGFLGRKCDGEPGWQTIWRGWHRLMTLIEGAELRG